MHTSLFTVTPDDEDPIGEVELKEGDVFSFSANSDLSGYVIVNHHRQEDPNDIESVYKVQTEVYIPAWMLLEYVGRYMQSEMQSRIDDTSGKEFLQLLLP
jgi:hypothetical protein